MRAIIITLAILGWMRPALASEDPWAEAAKSILRLPPTAFPELPEPVQEWLTEQAYTIPQSYMYSLQGPHNVVSGAFQRRGQVDWAVLASRNDSSAIVVFFRGSANDPREQRRSPDRSRLQVVWPDSIGYSRVIMLIDSSRIHEYMARGAEGMRFQVTHAGIEDSYLEKASTVVYYDRGKWLSIGGAD
jgi:hypothetical protein